MTYQHTYETLIKIIGTKKTWRKLVKNNTNVFRIKEIGKLKLIETWMSEFGIKEYYKSNTKKHLT